jgi:hypothetical protein
MEMFAMGEKYGKVSTKEERVQEGEHILDLHHDITVDEN